MGQSEQMVGQRFGRLTVTEPAPPRGKHSRAKCRCDCGEERIVYSGNLSRGYTKSCGCLKRAATSARRLIHGATVGGCTHEYGCWIAAKGRCLNPNNPKFKHYGGRGIAMCDRWLHSFQSFRDDMGPCPPGLTLDRKDNDGNYEPGNCRWTDQATQQNNRQYRRRLTWGGRTMTLSECAREVGLTYKALHGRLERGWTLDRLFALGGR